MRSRTGDKGSRYREGQIAYLLRVLSVVGCLLVFAGCGSDSTPSPHAETSGASPATAASPPPAAEETKSLRGCLEAAGLDFATSMDQLPEGADILNGNAEAEAAAIVGGLGVTQLAPTDDSRWTLFDVSPEDASTSREENVVLNDESHFVAYSDNASPEMLSQAEGCLSEGRDGDRVAPPATTLNATPVGLRKCFEDTGLDFATSMGLLPEGADLGSGHAKVKASVVVSGLKVIQLAPAKQGRWTLFQVSPEDGSASQEEIVATNDESHFIAYSSDPGPYQRRGADACMGRKPEVTSRQSQDQTGP
jgi:hypothetical protein